MADRQPIRLALLVWFLIAPAAPATAQGPAVAPITLADGVRQALDKAYLVQLAREDVNVQQATVRQARGAFDSILQIGPLFEHREDNIENTAFFDPERVKRGFAKGLHTGFAGVADALAEHLRQGRGDLPLCPPDGTFSSYVVTLPGSVLPVPLCRPASLSLGVPSVDETTGVANDGFLFRQALPFDPMSSFNLQLLLASAFRAQISTVSLEARERSNELLLTLQSAARIVEIKAGLVSDRLGVLPEFVYADTASIFGQYTKPFRNGSVFQFTASFDGRATLFRDKPIDPSFGGTETPNAFGNRLEWAWVQPLKRGRGADSVRAAERAAAKNVEASRFSFQQASADQALATADAYFELMAAQDSLGLTRQSLTDQRQLLDSTIRLVGAAEVASADVARSRARTAEVESDVETARLAVVAAQARLADAMGLPSTELTTLAASDVFPVRPLDLDIEALSREAVARRADVKALTAFRDTSRILLAAARADSRSRFDVRVSGGVAQAYFGPRFNSLGDEADKDGRTRNNDLYVKYYNPTGFRRAFQQKWEPIGLVTGTFELPFGNNQRLGRLAQAVASSRSSEIQVADLGRTIENNLPKLADNLRQLRAEWEQRQEAVIQYEATWDTAQRLRGTGDLTLIDTLLTEQQLTQARLQLVQAKRDYASAVARFRRETGVLVDFTEWSRAQLNLAGIVVGR